MADLVLLRHGRTDWNAARRIQGQADSQLDELGHAQAAAVAPVLAALSPSVLWSSDSDRARDTASYLAAACGLTPTYDARLREYSLGPREGLTTTSTRPTTRRSTPSSSGPTGTPSPAPRSTSTSPPG